MKIKTSEATGLQLDWGLAVVVGEQHNCKPTLQDGIVWMPVKQIIFGTTNTDIGGNNHIPFSHTDPAVCMGLIKEYCIQLYPFCDGEIVRWDADIRPDVRIVNCDTPEQAVARCVIAMRLGDEFECPDELGVQS